MRPAPWTPLAALIFACLLAPTAIAAGEAWQRGVDKGVHGAGLDLEDGTFLGFFCAPHTERRLSFMILKPGLLTNPIHYDEKAMDVRFIVGVERFDLPGKAEDGEIYVEFGDFNLDLQFDRLGEALARAERAWVAIPIKRWSLEIPVAGAGPALRGLMTPCR